MKKLTLLFFMGVVCSFANIHAQFIDSTFYDFTDESSNIYTTGISDNDSLILNGNYSYKNSSYGLNMKVEGEISVVVDGSCSFLFLGSKWSSLYMEAASKKGIELEEKSTAVTTDLQETFDFVYDGPADTLTFTTTLDPDGGGSDLYLPQLLVVPEQPGGTKNLTEAIENIIYYFDFRDGSIIPNSSDFNGNYTIDSGLVKIECGTSNAYKYQNTTYGAVFKTGNKITLQVAGNSYIKVGGCQYNSTDASVEVSSESGDFDITSQLTKTASETGYDLDSTTIDFLYVGNSGEVTLDFTGTNYVPIIKVVPYPYDIELVPWKQKTGSVIINGVNISLDAGESSIDTTSVSISEGTVTSVGMEVASVVMKLEGEVLSSYSATVTNDISSVTMSNDTIFVAYADSNYKPYSYTIVVTDNSSNGKIDVWDLGAKELDTNTYNNILTEDIINGWYDESITVASEGNVLPGSWSEGVVSWTGGTNDRLRTTNKNLTRYDAQLSDDSGYYTGRIYVNGSAATSRYLSIELNEDDEVTLVALSQSGGGILNFIYTNDEDAQTNQFDLGSEIDSFNLVAKEAGTYIIYDSQDKPSYFRIYRADATYTTITGTVDTTAATGIPADFTILFENEAGKTWSSSIIDGSYSIKVPAGYTYNLSLGDANGYVINNGTSLDVTEETSTYNISIEKVELYTVTGVISGLGDLINALSFTFTADPSADKIYIPEPVVNATDSSYTVQLEPNCKYTITGVDVNDYYIADSILTISITDATHDIIFYAKPVYDIIISANDLDDEQLESLGLTFTNLYEEGYEYSFDSINDIKLRNGVYTIDYYDMDAYPVKLALTSNLSVDDASTTKELSFEPIEEWTFDDKTISSGDTAYNGLLLSGSISSELAKGHLVGKSGGTIKVPVSAGQKVVITYYWSASFVFEESEDTIIATTSANTTGSTESSEYYYEGTEDGYILITFTDDVTTYITNIARYDVIDLNTEITVGENKNYKTINEALTAVAQMDRPNNERVTILIDPGNYEEMLDISVDSITLKNASSEPSIAITNGGVDIDENAVRITSYYGHGYNYYSMGSDQKWSEEVLSVNKENGYISYENTGSGTTNNSYWNATVIVSAAGFEADQIIFENSFNQYISTKESKDVVEEWTSGGKGTRPTDTGNTDVQYRTYVERAAAIAFTGSADKSILFNCRIIGRQDSFYGEEGMRIAVYKGAMMGAVDYIFGGMTAVFYQSDLVMNTSDHSSDQTYITAAYQKTERGYLMYECNVVSPDPGVETASENSSKPGFFGRPWLATTSEVVFFNTTIATCENPDYSGESLIDPEGWKNSLGGESSLMYEYGTIEESGLDNSNSRASWSTLLSSPTLTDGTEISAYNFTKGDDGWNPLPGLIERDDEIIVDTTDDPGDTTSVKLTNSTLDIFTTVIDNEVYIKNITSKTDVTVYNLNGVLFYEETIYNNTSFPLSDGLWIISVKTDDGQKVIKTIVY